MPAPLPIAFAAIQRQSVPVTLPRRRLPLQWLAPIAIVSIVGAGAWSYRVSGTYGERFAGGGALVQQYQSPGGEVSVFGYDVNRDGRLDSWTYLEGGHVVRTEVDENGDGEIDRWYFYDRNEKLTRVETSSRAAGVLDDAPPMVDVKTTE